MAMRGSWSVPPSLFADVVEEDLTKRVRTIALAMLQEIVLRSPVDTGRFRNNNIVSIVSPVYASTVETDASGAGTISRGAAAMSGLEPIRRYSFRTTSLTRKGLKMVTLSRRLQAESTQPHSTAYHRRSNNDL